MAIEAGKRFGPYEILSAIGAGGMGEVYRAKDTRLNRVVAIKVLPFHLSDLPQLKQRFDREAQAISSLSHPHICALYDVGEEDGVHYLVMEFLEGVTLARKLDKGALPSEQTLRYGIQIAEALDKAHRQGIVHRDLKPANVMITKSGARLLDFGLAKYYKEAEPGVDSRLETAADLKPLTEEGLVLGTVQYMAPEQVEGKEADPRTDIFALGVVLYEMATGKHAFHGKSKAGLMSAILTSEPPPISQVQSLAPTALDHVVRKCLAKDPDDRWQSAHDVAGELQWISEQASSSKITAPHTPISKRKLLPIALGILTILFAGLASFFYFTREPKKSELIRLSMMPEEKSRISGQIAISRDGKKIAFVAKRIGEEVALWVRDMDKLEAKQLPGTRDASLPFWSPDSRHLGFFASGKLKRIDIEEGPPQTLADAPSGRGGTWNHEGTILFSPNFTSTALYKISASGGKPEQVTELGTSSASHVDPIFLPDGKHFLYRGSIETTRGVLLGSLDSPRDAKMLLKDPGRAEYSSGHILFVRERTLLAQPFDAKKLELSGEAKPIIDKIGFDGSNFSFSSAPNETLIYTSVDSVSTQLVWMDREGKQLGALTPEPGSYLEPYFAPEEKKVVIGRFYDSSRVNLWIVDPLRQSLNRFTVAPTNQYGPVWSPDGKTIVYSWAGPDRGNLGFDLYEKPASGAGAEKVLVNSKQSEFTDDWSADGQHIMYEMDDPKTKYDLWYIPMMSDRKPRPYLATEFNEAHAKFSPDGKWVAYGSDEIGRTEIFVRPFPNASGGKWQVSTAGGDQPYWRADGKELYFLAPDGVLMAVAVSTGDHFEMGVPEKLFQTYTVPQPLIGSDRNQYAVSADGKRFLINSSPSQTLYSPIQLVFNWTKLLKK